MAKINDVIKTLSEEELDLLNSDPRMLSDFKKKYGIDAPKRQQSKGPGIMETIKTRSGLDLSPQSTLARLPELASKGFEKAGQFATEELGRQQVNPNVSAAVGTAISMAPEMAMTGIDPTSKVRFPKSAVGFARRSLGFQKRHLMTPFARNQAAEAAKMALAENIIPLSGNPELMASRAESVAQKAGEKLGEMRKSAGPQKLDKVFDSLEALRNRLTKGRTGGEWDQINKRINNAQETILGLSDEGTATLTDLTEAKNRLSDTVNWLSDKASQGDTKKIANSIERGIEEILGSAGKDVTKYRSLKKTYGASKNALRALQNELAGQEGNMAASLPSQVVAAGQLATGSPLKAAATLGIVEALKRRGAGISAKLLTDAANPSFAPGSPALAMLALQRLARVRERSKKK